MTTGNYSVLAHKATRGAIVIKRGFVNMGDALSFADNAYEATKAISFNWLSGIAVIIVKTSDEAAILQNGFTTGDERVLYQYGSY